MQKKKFKPAPILFRSSHVPKATLPNAYDLICSCPNERKNTRLINYPQLYIFYSMIVHHLLHDSTWLPPCVCLQQLDQKLQQKGRKITVTCIRMKGCHSKYHHLCVPPGTARRGSLLGDMKSHHQLESHTTSDARCIMSVQYIYELATHTKRAYDMMVWDVKHGSSSPLVVFFPPTSGGLGPTATVVLKQIDFW